MDGIALRLRRPWFQTVALAVVVLAILLPRAMGLDRLVTVDEDKWATRSANFYTALSQGDFANTYQKEHPGVTTMWAGSAGILWRFATYRWASTSQVTVDQYNDILGANGHTLLEMLVAGRFFMILANTLALAIAFLFARRLFGLAPALLGFLLIAFDPFHIAHSRLLHLDGLLSSLLLLALLAFLSFLESRRLFHLMVAGAAAGLSWLTKSPGFFLIPAVVLVSAAHGWARRCDRRDSRFLPLLWQFVWPLVVWGLAASVVFVALWPAMWVDPIGTLAGVLGPALSHATGGHANPVFFNGQIYADGQVSTPIFYPVSYLWRSTPVVLAGLLFGAIGFVARREPLAAWRRRCFGLVVFVIVFALLQNLGKQKFDRYLLPVFLPLDLVAALGWMAAARWIRRQMRQDAGRKRLGGIFIHGGVLAVIATPLLLGAAILVQVVGTLQTFPYYLSYYNPVMGGSRKAPEVMMIGWGEGLDQAASYLSERPNSQNLRVLAWYSNGFYPFFPGATGYIPQISDMDEAQLQEMLDWQYAVLYSNEWQRQMPKQLLDLLARQTPVHSVWINGLEYARIYKLIHAPAAPEPSQQIAEGNLGDMARLVGYNPAPPLQTTAGASLSITLTWECLETFRDDYTVFVHLVSPDQSPLAQADSQPLGGAYPTSLWDVGEQVTDPYSLAIPADLPPGRYELLVGMYLLSTSERLPLLNKEGQVLGDSISLGTVEVKGP
jgi:4-amino-4-deoxy-L-arabinose transferase-like glycosyltransferase